MDERVGGNRIKTVRGNEEGGKTGNMGSDS